MSEIKITVPTAPTAIVVDGVAYAPCGTAPVPTPTPPIVVVPPVTPPAAAYPVTMYPTPIVTSGTGTPDPHLTFTFPGEIVCVAFDVAAGQEWLKFSGGAIAGSAAKLKAWTSDSPGGPVVCYITVPPTDPLNKTGGYNADMYFDVTNTYNTPPAPFTIGRHYINIQGSVTGQCNLVRNTWAPPPSGGRG